MLSFVGRSGALAPFFTASSQLVANPSKAIIPAIIEGSKSGIKMDAPQSNSPKLVTCAPAASTVLLPSMQVRLVHTDIQMPDFSYYRRDSTSDPNKSSKGTEADRKMFTYMFTLGAGITAAYTGKTLATTFVMSLAASADVLALAQIEIDLSDIPEGKNMTYKWRGKPLFVRHRTPAEIAEEQAVDISRLRDQEPDSARVIQPEWLIVLGICTHLGCVPIANAGNFGGYYCPCHGSHYDAAGRIRQGPAPLNLEVPPYVFNGSLVTVG